MVSRTLLTWNKQGVDENVKLEATPSGTTLEFRDHASAQKFYHGLPKGELPGVGKIEMSWIRTPLPPIDMSKYHKTVGVELKEEEDTEMGNGDGGQQNGGGRDAEQHDVQQDLDYDTSEEVRDW